MDKCVRLAPLCFLLELTTNHVCDWLLLLFFALLCSALLCSCAVRMSQVSCGLCSDPTAEADPDKVTRYWKEEFDALYAETMAHDGGGHRGSDTRDRHHMLIIIINDWLTQYTCCAEVPPPKRAGVWRRNRFTIAAVLLLSAASWAIMHSVAARPMSSTASH